MIDGLIATLVGGSIKAVKRLPFLCRRNVIADVVGWSNIRKSAFCQHSIGGRLTFDSCVVVIKNSRVPSFLDLPEFDRSDNHVFLSQNSASATKAFFSNSRTASRI